MLGSRLTVGSALIIRAGPTALVNCCPLAHPLAVFIGLITCPLYLWHFVDNEYDVRLLSGDLGDNPARDEFRDLLRRTPTNTMKAVIDEPIKSVEDLLLHISKTDSAVATRFHNVVLVAFAINLLSLSHSS
jgi:hypothetical protein